MKTETKTENAEETIDNQLELKKYLIEVQARLKDNITSDYTLAKLEDKDKEGIIEMTDSAYYAQRLIQQATRKFKKYRWNEKTKEWEITKEMTPKETERIKGVAGRTFDAYMIKLNMVTILNRNRTGNYLIDKITGTPTEEEITEEEHKNTLELLKEKLKPRQEE